MQVLQAQMRWGQTPLTSCFFDGCVEKAQDLTQGTKYNILSCGGIAFANAVDCLAAVREVVYEKQQATLDEVAQACAANFQGHERLRAKLLAAPKHGNDDPRLDDIIRAGRAAARRADEGDLPRPARRQPVRQLPRRPQQCGRPWARARPPRPTAAWPVRRWPVPWPPRPAANGAGRPPCSIPSASSTRRRAGNAATRSTSASTPAWSPTRASATSCARCSTCTSPKAARNCRSTWSTRPRCVPRRRIREQYRDLVVRVAGFSEFFVNLTPEMQEEIIARTEHL